MPQKIEMLVDMTLPTVKLSKGKTYEIGRGKDQVLQIWITPMVVTKAAKLSRGKRAKPQVGPPPPPPPAPEKAEEPKAHPHSKKETK